MTTSYSVLNYSTSAALFIDICVRFISILVIFFDEKNKRISKLDLSLYLNLACVQSFQCSESMENRQIKL